MSSRSVRKVRHHSPTTFTFGERVRAGQEKIELTELWKMSVPRYQTELTGENETTLAEALEALRPEGGYQIRAERRKSLVQKVL